MPYIKILIQNIMITHSRYKLLIISFLLFTGCSSYMSTYQNSPLKIDGSSSDWKTTLESKSSGISYGVSNDLENIYLRLNITDQDIQKKILMAGLTIWIDTTGNKKTKVGITCPIQKAPFEMNKNTMHPMKDESNWNKNQILEAEFIGFKKSIESYYLSSNPYKVEVSIDIDEFKSMYYEMLIPLSVIYKNYANLSSKSLSLGFETGSIEMPDHNSMPGGMVAPSSGGAPGGRSGGMSAPSSGGMGGGRPGGMQGGIQEGMQNQGSMADLSSPTTFWIKNIQLEQP